VRFKSGGGGPALFFTAALFLSACGIEDYPYLEPIALANVTQTSNYQATVTLNSSNSSLFSNYAIFYRIYVSSNLEYQPSKITINAVNSTMYSDYTAIEAYIGNDSVSSSSIAGLFSSRRFNTLLLENADINSVLGVNDTIVFDFPQNNTSPLVYDHLPKLLVAGSGPQASWPAYVLRRSNGNDTFNPRPDRRLLNTYELVSAANVNSNINADVVGMSGLTPAANWPDYGHSYIMMYIVAVGFDLQNLSPLYSTPSKAIILRLSDP